MKKVRIHSPHNNTRVNKNADTLKMQKQIQIAKMAECQKWTEESLRVAVQKVKSGELSQNRVAKLYGIQAPFYKFIYSKLLLLSSSLFFLNILMPTAL